MKRSLSYLTAAALLIAMACSNPIDDIVLSINPTFYKYVVEIELEDVTGAALDPNATYTVEVTGDVDEVYNLDATKNYEVNFGRAQFLLSKAGEPTAGNPVNFTVKVASNTYREINVPVSVGVEDFYLLTRGPLLNDANPPSGITTGTGNGDAGSGTLPAPVTVTSTSANGSSDMELTVPAGVTFADANGTALSGALEVAVSSISDTNQAAQTAFEALTPRVVMINGVADTVEPDGAPTFEINMTVGGAQVSTFGSGAVTTRVDLPAGFFNPETSAPYVAGDSVDMISYTDGDASWEQEPSLVVQQDAQGLYIAPELTHLSWRKLRRRGSSPRIKARFGLKTTSGAVTAGARIKFTMTRYGRSSRGILNNFGITISSSGYRALGNAYFGKGVDPNSIQVTDFIKTGEMASWTENGPFFNIDGNLVEINYDLSPPVAPATSVTFSLICPSATVNTPPAGVKLYFRPTDPSNTTEYTLLYTFLGSENSLTSTQLTDGATYDFRALYNDKQIDDTYTINNGQHYNLTLPPEACSEIGL